MEMDVKTVMKRKMICMRTIREDNLGMAKSSTNAGSMMTVA